MSAEKSLTFQSRMVNPPQIALLLRRVTYTKKLEDGLLADGLVIFGDNGYLTTKYIATLYPNIAGRDKDKSKDNYNFYPRGELVIVMQFIVFCQSFVICDCCIFRCVFGLNVHSE